MHILALLCLSACSSGAPASPFQSVDGSIADGAGIYDAPIFSEEFLCEQPAGPVYCSETKGPVASLDAAGAGVIVECPVDYPSCEPPGFGAPVWVCCFNCLNPPLASCMALPDAGTDGSGGVDASE
jgi:hypothetical protein